MIIFFGEEDYRVNQIYRIFGTQPKFRKEKFKKGKSEQENCGR